MPDLKISTLSVMVGTPACTYKCPFCISKMTHRVEKGKIPKNLPLERISFLANKFLAVHEGIPYGIITGKGEPTLAPKEYLGNVIEILYKSGLVPELQTNGTRCTTENLEYWKGKGLNTLAISCVSHLDKVNYQLLAKEGEEIALGKITKEAREFGLLVRLTVILAKGGIDSPDSFLAFMRWAKESGVHQITLRKMGEPRNLALPGSEEVAKWIRTNYVDPSFFIVNILKEQASEKETWPWALRFGYDGISVIVTDCMNPPKDGKIRHAVIQPDGHLYGSWDDPADILI